MNQSSFISQFLAYNLLNGYDFYFWWRDPANQPLVFYFWFLLITQPVFQDPDPVLLQPFGTSSTSSCGNSIKASKHLSRYFPSHQRAKKYCLEYMGNLVVASIWSRDSAMFNTRLPQVWNYVVNKLLNIVSKIFRRFNKLSGGLSAPYSIPSQKAVVKSLFVISLL